jgi:hypothetical protein
MARSHFIFVMPGLVPGISIHKAVPFVIEMAGTQVGYSRLEHYWLSMSGKPDIDSRP